MERNYYISEVKVGQKVENFEAEALLNTGEFGKVSLEENIKAGKWTVVFFWPLDFTFVCPTEILAMSNSYEGLREDGIEIFGVSTDSKYSHLAWTKLGITEGGIGKINFPMLEDTNHAIAEQFGGTRKHPPFGRENSPNRGPYPGYRCQILRCPKLLVFGQGLPIPRCRGRSAQTQGDIVHPRGGLRCR